MSLSLTLTQLTEGKIATEIPIPSEGNGYLDLKLRSPVGNVLMISSTCNSQLNTSDTTNRMNHSHYAREQKCCNH